LIGLAFVVRIFDLQTTYKLIDTTGSVFQPRFYGTSGFCAWLSGALKQTEIVWDEIGNHSSMWL